MWPVTIYLSAASDGKDYIELFGAFQKTSLLEHQKNSVFSTAKNPVQNSSSC